MNVAEPDRRPRDLFAKHARRGHARRTAGLAAVLVAALLLASHARAADWADKRVSGPFVCRADFRLDEYDGLFVELAQLQTDLSQALAVEPAHEPVELYLFQSEQSYRTYLQVRLPQVPYRRALFVKGKGPGKVFAYKSKALPVDVRPRRDARPLALRLADGAAVARRGAGRILRGARGQPSLWQFLSEMGPHGRPRGPHPAACAVGSQAGRVGDECHRLSTRLGLDALLAARPARAHDELVRFLADIHDSTPPGRLSERLEQRCQGWTNAWCSTSRRGRSRPASGRGEVSTGLKMGSSQSISATRGFARGTRTNVRFGKSKTVR